MMMKEEEEEEVAEAEAEDPQSVFFAAAVVNTSHFSLSLTHSLRGAKYKTVPSSSSSLSRPSLATHSTLLPFRLANTHQQHQQQKRVVKATAEAAFHRLLAENFNSNSGGDRSHGRPGNMNVCSSSSNNNSNGGF